MPSSSWYVPSDWLGGFYHHIHRRERTWTTTPNFRSVPRRDLPVNPYMDYWEEVKQQPVPDGVYRLSPTGQKFYDLAPDTCLWTGRDGDNAFRGMFTRSSISPDSEKSINALKLKLLNKIADVKTNAPVMYAEAKKTADMVEKAAERFVSGMVAARQGRWRAVAEIFGVSVPDTKRWKNGAKTKADWHRHWLEYKYGWMPMLMDVKGTAELFAQQWALGGRPPAQVVSVKDVVNVSYVERKPYHPTGYSDNADYVDNVQTLTGTRTHRLMARMELNSPSLNAAQQAGLTNPLLLAWELVPYSFVVDWFCHVGDWLTALTALNGVTIKQLMLSELEDLHYTYTDPPTLRKKVDGWTYVNTGYKVQVNWRWYRRSIPVLDVFQIWPSVENPFPDFKKAVSSIALLKGRLR